MIKSNGQEVVDQIRENSKKEEARNISLKSFYSNNCSYKNN